ncbi:nitroreductase family protein [Planctomicrobium sp. SH668]|uniref:nitroreductase family protein n=1 Tax=Planctomicrobium sp. SH668 TaxID=3448126 RepID=UPI003F5C53CC
MELSFQPAQDAFSEVLRSRRTVSDFLPKVPPLEVVLQAIELARWAPNHKMTEPWRFHFLGPETRHTLIEINRAILTAEKGADHAEKKLARWKTIPGWVIVTSERAEDEIRDQENYAASCCAVQNFMLSLWAHEIGTKWATSPMLRDPRVSQALSIDSTASRIVGLIWYGYPASLPVARRRPVTEITIFHP